MNSDRIVGTRSGVEPSNLFAPDPTTGDDMLPHAAELRRWMVEYLCRSHPDLGRPGAVCPFTSHAIAQRFLWAAFVPGRDIDRERIIAIIDDLHDLFPYLPPQDESGGKLKAVLAVFPDLTEYADIDTVQRDRKTRFVEQGLMLGQFYPGCTVAGLHNPDFPALDAPLPLLAIRHMVPTDFPFLSARREWLECYLELFAPTIPRSIATTMSDRIVRTPDELNELGPDKR